jgi:hypothetical protein
VKEVAATKDGSCVRYEVLFERSEKKQRLEDGAWGIGQFDVAMDCEDPSGLLMKDGCSCGRIAESFGESGLFA